MALKAPARDRRHPGRGGKGRRFDRGRQVEEDARAEIAALLGDRPRRRDLLIEHLHLIQDRYGGLSKARLAALAEALRLSQTEVWEVATFYAHFDVDEPFSGTTVRVCDSVTCANAGAAALLAAEIPGARVLPAPCIGRCAAAPAAAVGRNAIDRATPEALAAAVRDGATAPDIPAYETLAACRAAGGYESLRACRAGERSRESVFAAVEASGLRGLGGAGFPTARKWRFVAAEPGPRLMVVNADEGEPGTFKDRWALETEPHRFLEGMALAAWAVEAAEIYIYLRDEYPAAREILIAELAALREAGLDGGVSVHLRRGAGAYICGEETALLESLEGKRGLPRHRPPFPAQEGLFGRPTLIHNVETLYWLRPILEGGGEAFAARGANGGKGLRAWSVSGRVREPGVKIAPAGVTVRELIDSYCGGMAPGHRFKAFLPGGASGGLLPARLADLPLDFGAPRRPRLLRRLRRGHRAVRPRFDPRHGAQSHAVLRGRKLRPVHPLPRRHREGAGAHGARRLGRAAAARVERGDGRRLDLRARPGRRPTRCSARCATSPRNSARERGRPFHP